MNYVGEHSAKQLTVDIYTGDNGEFLLYEDDGTTNAYENGAYSIIPISYEENDDVSVVTFGERQGGQFDGLIPERRFNVRLHMPERVMTFTLDYKGTSCQYSTVLKF